jgi:hypothetical protein
MSEISTQLELLSYKAQSLANHASQLANTAVETTGGHSDFLIFGITVLLSSMFCWILCSLVSYPSSS